MTQNASSHHSRSRMTCVPTITSCPLATCLSGMLPCRDPRYILMVERHWRRATTMAVPDNGPRQLDPARFEVDPRPPRLPRFRLGREPGREDYRLR